MRAKDLNEAYRAAAQVRIYDCVKDASVGEFRVNPHGTVLPTEGGAFVELMLWVPKEELPSE
jgi:hypothetical protein